jgi:hypothetical protein
MLDSYKPNTGDLEGHLKIYKDFQEIMDSRVMLGIVPYAKED